MSLAATTGLPRDPRGPRDGSTQATARPPSRMSEGAPRRFLSLSWALDTRRHAQRNARARVPTLGPLKRCEVAALSTLEASGALKHADRRTCEANLASARTLEEEYLAAQKAAVLEIADQGLISLAQLVQSGAIDVSPKFQRRDRWTADKQSLLIESFLVNIPVPPVYLAEDEGRIGHYAVIDGKQRLTAIDAFFSDRLVLRNLTRLESLNGVKYSTMPPGVRNSLGMKNLRVTTLLRQSDEALKHEVFLRLNTGGEVLNAQEIRNVAYRGPLNDLIYELAENRFLRAQFKVLPPSSPAYRRMTDAEFVLRFFALADRWRAFTGDIRLTLDAYMADNRFAKDSELERLAKVFENSITVSEAIWGRDAFKWPGRDQALAGLFDAQMIAIAELGTSRQAALISAARQIKTSMDNLFKDAEFEEAVRQATNTPTRLRYRIKKLQDALLASLS